MSDEFYPENLMPIASQLEVRYRRFSELREQVLLDYGYNTARAYWSDLDSICIWALERDKDPLDLTEKEIRQYIALLRRRKYSENTIRRRVTALRKLYRAAALQSNTAHTFGVKHGSSIDVKNTSVQVKGCLPDSEFSITTEFCA